MSIILPSVGLLAAGALVYLLLKAWPKPILAIFSGLGCFLVFVAFLFIYKKTVISREREFCRYRKLLPCTTGRQRGRPQVFE